MILIMFLSPRLPSCLKLMKHILKGKAGGHPQDLRGRARGPGSFCTRKGWAGAPGTPPAFLEVRGQAGVSMAPDLRLQPGGGTQRASGHGSTSSQRQVLCESAPAQTAALGVSLCLKSWPHSYSLR